MMAKKTAANCAPGVRERAVQLMLDGAGERRVERDRGKGTGAATHERDRIKVPERENRELRGAHALLRKASMHLARAELDRRSKP
jgi:transposase-like protein